MRRLPTAHHRLGVRSTEFYPRAILTVAATAGTGKRNYQWQRRVVQVMEEYEQLLVRVCRLNGEIQSPYYSCYVQRVHVVYCVYYTWYPIALCVPLSFPFPTPLETDHFEPFRGAPE